MSDIPNDQPATLDSIGEQLAELGAQIETLARLIAGQGGRIDNIEIKIGKLKRALKDAHANEMMALDAILNKEPTNVNS